MAGLRVMMEGGNAVDAALNVVAPHAAGVGGDVGVPAPSSGSLLVEGRQDLLIQALEGFDVTGPRGQHDLIDTRIIELADSVDDVIPRPRQRPGELRGHSRSGIVAVAAVHRSGTVRFIEAFGLSLVVSDQQRRQQRCLDL